jgi:hypothetical protein
MITCVFFLRVQADHIAPIAAKLLLVNHLNKLLTKF